MFGLSTLATRVIIGAIGLALLLLTFQVTSCVRAKQQAAQGKVDKGQGDALRNSAADAINTQAGVNANESASRDLDRNNAEEIRNAEGANVHIARPVRDAGLNSLCRRAAYRDDPECRMRFTPAP